VVANPVFAIRCRPKKIFTLQDYESSGILSDRSDPLNAPRERDNFLQMVRGLSHREIIQKAIAAKKNILIVGSTGSGKTTLVNAVLDELGKGGAERPGSRDRGHYRTLMHGPKPSDFRRSRFPLDLPYDKQLVSTSRE
jgi:hypothetical protein